MRKQKPLYLESNQAGRNNVWFLGLIVDQLLLDISLFILALRGIPSYTLTLNHSVFPTVVSNYS